MKNIREIFAAVATATVFAGIGYVGYYDPPKFVPSSNEQQFVLAYKSPGGTTITELNGNAVSCSQIYNNHRVDPEIAQNFGLSSSQVEDICSKNKLRQALKTQGRKERDEAKCLATKGKESKKCEAINEARDIRNRDAWFGQSLMNAVISSL
jgi:multidrug efflux pump subunit AcrB